MKSSSSALQPRRAFSSRALPIVALLLVTLVLPSCAGFGTRRAKVTPQRPRIGLTTQTTEFGTFEIEAGALSDPGDFFEAPVRVKTGVSPTAELYLLGSPYSNVDEPGSDPSGVGPLSIGYRQRLMNESKAYPATAFDLGITLPVGDKDLGSGFNDFYGGFSIDRTFNNILATAYYRINLNGTPQRGDLNVAHTATLAATMPLFERWYGLAELAAAYDVESSFSPIALNLDAIYDFTDTLVFDFGVILGLNDDAPDLALQAGFTTNLGILF